MIGLYPLQGRGWVWVPPDAFLPFALSALGSLGPIHWTLVTMPSLSLSCSPAHPHWFDIHVLPLWSHEHHGTRLNIDMREWNKALQVLPASPVVCKVLRLSHGTRNFPIVQNGSFSCFTFSVHVSVWSEGQISSLCLLFFSSQWCLTCQEAEDGTLLPLPKSNQNFIEWTLMCAIFF